MNNDLVVILTALNLEYEAVRKNLTDLRVHRHPAGTRFELGRPGGRGCRGALGLVGKGNHPAAVLAERAIAEFSPAAVLFVGVAGALWPSIGLGDVVVASQIYAYHGGTSEDDGLKARPRVWELSHGAGQIAQHVARSGEWAHGLPKGTTPKVRFGPIAAGEIVQDSAVSEQAQWVRQHYNDALAIEMEAAGVAQAGHLNHALPVVVVRGISDRADGTKSATDGENWQPRAVAHAAAFAVALAEELISDPRATGNHPEATMEKCGPAHMGMTNQNIATGNARVGVQAGQIFGPITIGAEPEPSIDLAAELADLRRLLDRAHRDGQLDEASYSAAETELEVADDCLEEENERSRSALVVALKKLRGLVSDVAELAAKVAAIIAVVKGLS
ncbi:5'-methylthioadenosine/S-adenosylhomocysteine nucleosidase [Actinopolymorpha alba]|uniref:5'-methylthioadenosine/S-adenosylhomocysteine nucleosidase family protein n=1 Tax=Actinopolymorpha alba TaxID=533267 RepID=UPI00035C5A60|nr:5'-methylthioadenosine/S-adenosylhomocysteine nucleosidase [Actinopolymorpha alba]